MNLPDDFIFSQSSLQDYVECARRFELRCLKHLLWPAVPSEPLMEYERHMQQGEAFHHLVHQHLTGLPAEVLSRSVREEPLVRWWDRYLSHGLTGLPPERYPELTLSAPLGDYALIAKYDLIAIQPGEKAVIVDWKTSRSLPKRDRLAKRLQTIVYRYVLALAGAHLNGGRVIAPEQIEMVYWFAEHPDSPERFAYDTAQFNADDAYLRGLVIEINDRPDFPLTDDVRRCLYCTYRSLCQRGTRAGDFDAMDDDLESDAADSGLTFDFDQIAEIEF